MVVINNPNNPTGARIPTVALADIVEFAKSRHLILFSDEVYRPLFHDLFSADADLPLPVTSMGYKKTIVTGSMSKAYALAGIRIGWVISPDSGLIHAMAVVRDHATISVSQLDDQVASYALSDAVRPNLLRRNVELVRANLALLSSFADKHSSVCSWVKPNAGTTAFMQFKKGGKPVDDVAFCIDVIGKTRVFIVPGSKCFGGGKDFVGYVRIGYVCHTKVLDEALRLLSGYVRDHLE
jgi:aspartate/methionine/tyrosine aminotransferase